MKVKAVIMRPDRTNDVVRVKKKNIEGKTFRHDNCTYFLHADRFMVTWTGRFVKKYYSTYYYIKGHANPLPVPDFQIVEEPLKDENGQLIMNGDGKPKVKQTFPKVIDNGIASEELAAIFNPWFYRIIASMQKDAMSQIQFYLVIATLCAVGYVIFKLHNLSVSDISGLVELLGNNPVVGPDAAPVFNDSAAGR